MRALPLALVMCLPVLSAPASASTFDCGQGSGSNDPVGLFGLDGAFGTTLGTRGLTKIVDSGIWVPGFVRFDGDCTVPLWGSLITLMTPSHGVANNDAQLLYTGFGDGNHYFTHHPSVPIHTFEGTIAVYPNFTNCNETVCVGTGFLSAGSNDPIGFYGPDGPYVPEPSTALLIALGLLGIAARRSAT